MSRQVRSRPLSHLLAQALQHHQSGELREADELYQQMLLAEPEHPDALHFSGLIAHQRGQHERAILLITRALEKEPERAAYRVNLGQVYEARGALDQAIAHYREATALDPDLLGAHQRLGDALLKKGQLDAAAASYGRALSIQPDAAETINSLGSLLYQAGRLEQSIVCLQKAIACKPDYAEAHNNLAIVYKSLGRWEEAVASLQRALAYKPTLAAAHGNLGEVLLLRGRVPEAIAKLLQAIEMDSRLAEPHLNLGNAYRSQGLLAQAIACYQRAASLATNPAAAYNNLGETLRDQGKLEEAARSYRQALDAKPGFAAAHSNLLYLYAFTHSLSPQAEKLEAQAWERSVLTEDQRAAARQRTFPIRPRAGRKLRLGILSAELGSHAVAQFLEPLLRHLDRSQIHLTLFPTARRSGPRVQVFRELADSYVPLTELTDSAAAERIRLETIDVLMDTTGHTFGGRLGIMAHRAAPVQCTYIGYWGTTGLTEMDWFFGDPYFLDSMEEHFTEAIWRLPRLYYCYQGESLLPESAWSPDANGTIWLGSLNRLPKIREQALHLWANVLHALPQAALLLEDGACHEDETHRRILKILASHGIAGERVTFVPLMSVHEQHMALYDRLDIALDTIPFNGGTTTFDALWMGVPVVALEGDWLGGRMSSAVLRAFDRPQWVARNETEYVSIVCALAADVAGRSEQRKSQRARMAMSELCDARGMARCMQQALAGMYDCFTKRMSCRQR